MIFYLNVARALAERTLIPVNTAPRYVETIGKLLSAASARVNPLRVFTRVSHPSVIGGSHRQRRRAHSLRAPRVDVALFDDRQRVRAAAGTQLKLKHDKNKRFSQVEEFNCLS